jgi:hypothetical protein
MVVRFAADLEITTDELLKPNGSKVFLRRKPSLRMLQRLEKMPGISLIEQKAGYFSNEGGALSVLPLWFSQILAGQRAHFGD